MVALVYIVTVIAWLAIALSLVALERARRIEQLKRPDLLILSPAQLSSLVEDRTLSQVLPKLLQKLRATMPDTAVGLAAAAGPGESPSIILFGARPDQTVELRDVEELCRTAGVSIRYEPKLSLSKLG